MLSQDDIPDVSQKRPLEEDSDEPGNNDSTQAHSRILQQRTKRKKDGKSLEEYFEFKYLDKLKVAMCKLYSSPNKNVEYIKMARGNTTGVKRHLEKFHKEEYAEVWEILPISQSETFSQDQLNKKTVDWVVKKYLPYRFFDDDETQNYFQYLNPTAVLPKRKALKNLISIRFKLMRDSAMRILENNQSKLSFTIDTWSSIAGCSYHGITVHFVNNDWCVHSFLIDFVPTNGDHAGRDIAAAFHKVMESLNLLEKVQGITVDNTSANTTFMRELSYLMEFDYENQHFRCWAHILNLSAQDMLSEVRLEDESLGDETSEIEEDFEADEDTENFELEDNCEEELSTDCGTPLVKLRKLFCVLKKSEQWRNKLKSSCDSCNIRMLFPNIDCKTRWHSSCAMIQTALNMENALDLLCQNNDALSHLRLTQDEWSILREICKHLRHFKTVSDLLSGDKYVTFPYVIVAFNMLLDKLDEAVIVLFKKQTRSSVEEKILTALQAATAKLIKHYNKSNWIYCAMLILDPRHKKDQFNKTSWGKEMARYSVKTFETIYKTKYNVPVGQVTLEDEILDENEHYYSDQGDDIDVLSFYDSDTESAPLVPPRKGKEPWRYEIDFYYSQKRVHKSVNILTWWKENEKLFPDLSRMSRDFLSIQATSVAAERSFSRSSLIIRKNRNKLKDESARELNVLNSLVSCSLASQIKAGVKE